MRILGPGRRVPSLAVGMILALRAVGQEPTGEIRLTIQDPAGAPMAASGRLIRLANGWEQPFQTDSQGNAVLERLPFGRYRLEVVRTAFAPESALLDVDGTAPIRHIVSMTLGSPVIRMEVVGTTPLAGTDQALEEIPSPVQAGSGREIEASGALDLSDYLNRRMRSVHLNEMQGNPYQADLNYRGYTASPLLGTPQGLSVYLDGVRLNQPFGDVVSWDLIPRIVVSETALLPGSNPLFGLNTLGGALSIRTKDGRSQPGTMVQLGGGSFGRKTADFEHGGSNAKGLNWYAASSLFFEDGWRTDSPSNVRQFFGRLGWQREKTTLGVSTLYSNNALTGNGIQEQRFLERDYSSTYTKPDITANKSPMVIVSGRHSLTSAVTVSGNAYYRLIQTGTFNGDINEESLDQALYQPTAADQRALTAAGYTGFPTSGENASNTPFPSWRCIAQVLQADEPAEKCNGLLNRSRVEQSSYGVSGQVSWFARPGGRRNQFTAGGGFDRSTADYSQTAQLGYLNPDRSLTGLNAYADGVSGGEEDGEPFDTRVDLNGRTHTVSVYAADTYSAGNRVNLTFAGRYNRTVVDNYDRLRPSGSGTLTGRHVFGRFNPSAGITFRPFGGVNAYASYSEGSRAPTSIELGCADPNEPCKLPNAMAGDPPLEQVVTRTFEAGVRGGMESRFTWNAGWFRAQNRDDILFVGSEQTGFGYFKNFGETRRQGMEAGFTARLGRFTLGGGYTYLDATFQSTEEVNGSGNSTNEEAEEGVKGMEGLIEIEPGNRIPLIPSHLFKTYVDIQATQKLFIDAGLVAMSSSYARGNENNRHEADGEYYLGPGSSPGYGVVNVGARYDITRHIQVYGQVNNLFNRRYYSAAQLGPTGFTATGNFIARPFPAVDGEYPVQQATFYAPGAPRGAWAGIRFRF